MAPVCREQIIVTRGANAQLAVNLYQQLHATHGWSAQDAWKGIALLLLTCDLYGSKHTGWQPFHGAVVYRESNDLFIEHGKPSAALTKARRLTSYLESLLGLPAGTCCQSIGQYWRQPGVSALQPHNLVGHAFRSIVLEILQLHGDKAVSYKEEVNPKQLFPGVPLHLRSKNPKIDFVAFRGTRPVAIISSRWRFRHDRVDVDAESIAYKSAAMSAGLGSCKFYAMLGEFSPPRLEKVLKNTVGVSNNPSIDGTVHFKPDLITNANAIGENGRTAALKPLDWLIAETHKW
jgi:hypothetical protein